MNKMRRIKYNKKNDERYLGKDEEKRLLARNKLSKIDKGKLDRFGKNSQVKYESLMLQQKAKAEIDYLDRQLKLYGKDGNMYYSYDELLNQLDEAIQTAWPNSKKQYIKEQNVKNKRGNENDE